jgi:hypothetical protein
MSGSSDRPPTKTTNPSTTEHISPAHPRVPAVTVKHPHPGRGGGGDGGAARKSTARTEEPTMAAGCNPAVETRTGSAAFEGGPKTARPTLRSLDRTRWPTPGRSQRPHCDRRQLLPFRGWGLAMVVDLWNVAVEQRSWGVGFGAESPRGLSHQHEPIAAGLGRLGRAATSLHRRSENGPVVVVDEDMTSSPVRGCQNSRRAGPPAVMAKQ